LYTFILAVIIILTIFPSNSDIKYQPRKEYSMKRPIALFLTLFLLFQITSYAYGEEVDKDMAKSVETVKEKSEEPDPNLKEKYELLREENLNLRKEILRLHNKSSS